MTDMAGFGDRVSDVASAATGPASGDSGNYPVPARSPSRQVASPLATTGVIDELLVGQVFLVQATIESASALGEGVQAARQALYGDGEISEVVKRTRRGVFEPYRERYNLFRQLPRHRQD